MIRPRSLVAAAVLVAASACQGESKGGGDGKAPAVAAEVAPAAPAETSPGSAAGADPVRYEDTTAGLEALVRDLQGALSAGDEERAARLLASLRLPDYQAWFAATFGERLGERIAADYRPHHDDIGLLAEVLGPRLKARDVQIRVERFARPGIPAATGYQSAALEAMKAREPLYSVRLVAGDDVFHLWSLVHEGQTFRYVGKLGAAADQRPPARGRDPLEFRLRDADRVAAGDRAR